MKTRFPKYAIDEPQVDFFTLGTSAGKACIKENKISFNLMIMLDQPEEAFIQTIIHEFAHRIVSHHFPHAKQHHGREWKYFMHVLGARVERTHSYNVEKCEMKKQIKKFVYSCSCGQDFNISTNRHTKLQSNVYKLVCPCCKSSFSGKQFTGKVFITKSSN